MIIKFLSYGFLYLFISYIPLGATWGSKAYQAYGMVAMSSLSSKSTRALKNFLHGQDVVDVSDWGRRLSDHYPQFKPYHTMFQDNETQCPDFKTGDSGCPNDICLLSILQSLFMSIVDTNDTVTAKSMHGLILNDTDLLKYFITLFADLHFPLAFGQASNQGGLLTEFPHPPGKNPEPTNIYDYYSNGLINDPSIVPEVRWNGGWTHARTLRYEAEQIAAQWRAASTVTDKSNLFSEWAKESRLQACNEIPKIFDMLQSGHPYIIHQGVSNLLENIQRQLLIGGVRLAHILDFAFENRPTQRFRQKSNIDLELEKYIEHFRPKIQESKKKASHSIMSNLAINLCLISIVLGIFYYFVRNKDTIATTAKPLGVSNKYAD